MSRTPTAGGSTARPGSVVVVIGLLARPLPTRPGQRR